MAIGNLTITDSDVVAGQKIFSSKAQTRIDEIEAWANSEVVAKALDKSSSQTITGAKTFTGNAEFQGDTIVPDQSAGNNSTKAANTKYVDGVMLAIKKVVAVNTSLKQSTDNINQQTEAFVIADGVEIVSVTLSGLTVGDVVEVEGFSYGVTNNGAASLFALFVDSVSASLVTGMNDSNDTFGPSNSVTLKAWFTATSTSHTFSLRGQGGNGSTQQDFNGGLNGTGKSWISATQMRTANITVS